MPRQKYQRPTVYATGKREKLWKVEYREYYLDQEGKEQSRHKSKTWSRADFTKAEAQTACDKFLAGLQESGARPDGAMTLERFWEDVYFLFALGIGMGNTPVAVSNLWKNHIKPKFGGVALKDINKAAIQVHLGRLADSGLGAVMVDGVRVRLYSVLRGGAR